MLRKICVAVSLLAVAFLWGCGGSSSSGPDEAAFKAALPDLETLLAPVPEVPESAKAQAVGDPAVYPRIGIATAQPVNGTVVDLVTALHEVASHPYTFVDTLESGEVIMVWGPFPNEDGAGQLMLTIIRLVPETSPGFQYTYVFFRTTDDFDPFAEEYIEPAAAIIGFASPTAPEGPYGLTLWDFDANADFAMNVLGEEGPFDYGLFTALYGQGVPDTDPEGTLALVLAGFQDFVPKDDPTADPLMAQYLYGHYVSGEGSQVDFLDLNAMRDVHEDDEEQVLAEPEMINLRMAFLNQGAGRAEVTAAGGDIGPGEVVTAVECWDDNIDRQYLLIASTAPWSYAEGELANCTPAFENDLATLGIPTLEDVGSFIPAEPPLF